MPGKDGRRAGDLLNRDFTAEAPNRIWVTDFTYVPVYSGFVYVALVIDLHFRAIVGWEASTVNDTALVEHCLRMALWRRQLTGRPVPAKLIYHSVAGKPVRLDPLHRHPGLGGLAAIQGSVCLNGHP
ncbi:DDE-type integrase/transposase/recombinase [Arthrobacter sp. 24S4-2]|uniref:DDE-type integrase/transposase/recombinase n=1 Tax=Arthrobacter sp. 24S4-2 TaxID=2575374 RepID=UPI0010C7D2DC|nr:DDE-type integrase/transposase/recombinase [Arthrobacter sp. 24S4-2]